MIVFDRMAELVDGRLRIPSHSRAVLGLHSQSSLHITRIGLDNSIRILNEEGEIDDASAERLALSNEIVISKIPMRDRRDVWTLESKFENKRGIIERLSKILLDQNINIISSNMISSDNSESIYISMLIECSSYNSKYDGMVHLRRNHNTIRLYELEARIAAEMIDSINFVSMVNPDITIKRNSQQYNSLVRHSMNVEDEFYEPSVVEIPSVMIDEIRKNMIAIYYDDDMPDKFDSNPLVSIAADGFSKIIRLFVFYRHTGFMHVRIRCSSERGALYDVSRRLNSWGYNILQSYVRNINNNKFALMDMLVHLEYGLDERKNDLDLRNNIVSALSDGGGHRYILDFPEPRGYNE